jgi:Ice-binding-like
MKKKVTLSAFFVFAMIVSANLVNHVSAQATVPNLGTAAGFAVLGGSTVTNNGPSVVVGDVGVSPGSAITGFPPGIVLGTIHAGDPVAVQAQSDAAVAYNNLAGQACGTNLTGQDLGGLTLTTGIYCFNTSAQLTGTLTLDAQGNPNAVFIFQIGSTLTTASNSSVVMINGGIACNNVYFQVGSSATVGVNTSFQGNILALTSITINAGASFTGRALAQNGAVTLDTNSITICKLSPTAAMVNVGGCVTNADGQGISKALITMTNGAGVVRTAYTAPFGYYNFTDVEVGQIVIVQVSHKRYNFIEPTRVVSLTEKMTTLDFTAY